MNQAQSFHSVSLDLTHDGGTAFRRRILELLRRARFPFLVGGAFGLEQYTGIRRETKDLDIFVRREDIEQGLALLHRAGYRTELTFPHWLGKAYHGEHFVDVIFSSGNGVAVVDEEWFEYATMGDVLGVPAQIVPPEEMIWSKAFILERERYDGADVNHLIRACGDRLDWDRLLSRFGRDWRVLLSHLVLYGYVYPAERDRIPSAVIDRLLGRLEGELWSDPPSTRMCQGTLLSREQYLVDVEQWGYEDARLRPDVSMSPEDIARWTNAIPGRSGHHGEGHPHDRRRR